MWLSHVTRSLRFGSVGHCLWWNRIEKVIHHPPPIHHQRSITKTLTSHVSFPVSLADLPTHNLLNLLYVWDVHFLCQSSRPQKHSKLLQKLSFKNFKDPTKTFKQIQAPNNHIFLGLNAFDFWQVWPKTWKLNHYPFSNILLLEIILLQKHDHDGRLEHCICICECVCVRAPPRPRFVRLIYICELWASAKLVVFFPLPTCIINAGSDKNRRGGCTIEKYRAQNSPLVFGDTDQSVKAVGA